MLHTVCKVLCPRTLIYTCFGCVVSEWVEIAEIADLHTLVTTAHISIGVVGKTLSHTQVHTLISKVYASAATLAIPRWTMSIRKGGTVNHTSLRIIPRKLS